MTLGDLRFRWRFYRREDTTDEVASRALAIETDRMLDQFRDTIAASREEALRGHIIKVRTGEDSAGMWHEITVEKRS
jgi:hypothetical protein